MTSAQDPRRVAVKRLEEMQEEQFLEAGLPLRPRTKKDDDTQWVATGRSLGLDSAQLDELRSNSEKDVAEASRQMPSRYEDPESFWLMSELAARVEDSIRENGWDVPPRPLLGTLPLGNVNAMALTVPAAEAHIVLFQVGLFVFLLLMGKAFASAMPIVNIHGGFTFSTNAQELREHLEADDTPIKRMYELLASYIYFGDPRRAEPYRIGKRPTRLSSIFYTAAEVFLLGHEYSHLVHLAPEEPIDMPLYPDGLPPQQWLEEFYADHIGVRLAVPALVRDGVSFPVAYAGIDLALTTLELLDRALAIAQNGVLIHVGPRTHPPAYQRRELCRKRLEKISTNRREIGEAQRLASGLGLLGDMMWGGLQPQFARLHASGQQVASIWTISGPQTVPMQST